MWLSHHHETELDRCVVVRGMFLCRRCLILYPLAYATAAVAVWGPLDAAASWVPLAMMVLPVPTVFEWCREHVGNLAYSARRQVLLTVPAGVALGYGFARYLTIRDDQWLWVMAATWGGVCLAARSAGADVEPAPLVDRSVAGPSDPPEFESVVEQSVAGHHPDRHAPATGTIEE